MFEFEKVPGVKYKYNYPKIAEDLNALQAKGDKESNKEAVKIMRDMVLADLFFLLYFVMGLTFLNNPFHVARVYEVQKNEESRSRLFGYLYLWAREHGKSTIITKGLTIWEILRDPEDTKAIIAYNRALAKSFLRGIKTEFEMNPLLKALFPDVLYANPEKEAIKWSEDDGLIVKRKGIVPECTLSAWGLVEGMPTGHHYGTLIFDDLVTKDTVSTPEQIEKTKEAFRMADNISRRGGIKRAIGTIYHYNDLYSEMEKMPDEWKVQKFPAEVDEKGEGKIGGRPLYLTRAELDSKLRKQGAYVYSSQMLLKPVADDAKKFRLEWLKYFVNYPAMNFFIIGDPAGTKSHKSDYTVIWVIGVDAMKNRFIMDGVRDRLSLGERWKALKTLVGKWRPLNVGWEKYGMMGDIEYFKEKMADEGFYFNISPLGGFISKTQRIEGLMPLYEAGQIMIPKYLPYRQLDGRTIDIVQTFITEEYLTFPYCSHDDMLDCLARMNDKELGIVFPMQSRPQVAQSRPFDPFRKAESNRVGWMGR